MQSEILSRRRRRRRRRSTAIDVVVVVVVVVASVVVIVHLEDNSFPLEFENHFRNQMNSRPTQALGISSYGNGNGDFGGIDEQGRGSTMEQGSICSILLFRFSFFFLIVLFP